MKMGMQFRGEMARAPESREASAIPNAKTARSVQQVDQREDVGRCSQSRAIDIRRPDREYRADTV